MSTKKLVILFVPFVLFSSLFSSFSISAEKKEERKWEDEVVYSLMVDRFNNGDDSNDNNIDLTDSSKFQGGDFQGIVDKLDDLQEIGFTAILLSPIFLNEDDGYHGERVIDFYKTEEHFGSISDLKKLIKEVHERDMKVMFDFPVDRVGSNHPWLTDPDKKDWLLKPQSPDSKNHKRIDNELIEGLPELNLENEDVKAYLIDAAKWWINETNIDGYSLSNIDNVPLEFLKEFSTELKSMNEQFYLLGSVSEGDSVKISMYQEAGIIGMSDMPLNKPLRDAFSKIDTSSRQLFNIWEENQNVYTTPLSLAAFFDSKDTVRFTRDMVDLKQYPPARWKLALTYLYTQPEVPIIFYGSEIAVNGGGPPDNVPLMNFRADEELMEFIGELGKVRQDQLALSRGTMELLYEKNGMVIFKREYKNETIVVAINNTSKDQTVVINEDQLEADKELRGLLEADMVRSNDGAYKIVVDREMFEVYRLTDKSGYNIPFIIATFGVFVGFAILMYVMWKRGKNRDPYEKR